MIQLDNLSMSYDLEYGRLDVLAGVDLEIADGETLREMCGSTVGHSATSTTTK